MVVGAAEVGAGFAALVVEDEGGEVAARRAGRQGGGKDGFQPGLLVAVEGGRGFATAAGEGGVMRCVLREGVRRGRERFVAGVVVGLGVDEVFLQGAVKDAVARGAGAGGVGEAVRVLWQGDEPGGFADGEFCRGFAEVVPGAGGDAFDVAAHRRKAGVAVEDGRFVVVVFELECAQGLADFAGEGVRGAVDEARRLHGEGRGAAADAAAAQVFAKRADDGDGVDAVVLVVAAVFVVEQQRGVVRGQGAGRQAAFVVGGEPGVQYLAVAVIDGGRVVGAEGEVGRVGEVKAFEGERAEAAKEAEGEGYVVYGLFHLCWRCVMKFLWFVLLVIGVWLWRDWQRVQRLRARMARREAAEAAFERLVFALECQRANGEIDEARFRVLRDEAFRRLLAAQEE